MYRVSVVIPTYNSARPLGYTLRSLAAQHLPPDAYEVIVVDDGSTDDTRDVVAGFDGRLRLRYEFLPRDTAEVEAFGYCVSRVRNAGVRLASAPVLVLADAGVVAGPDFLAAHLAAHEDGQRRAVIGYTYGTHKLRPFRPLEEMLRSRSPEEVVAAIGAGPRGLDLRHPDFDSVGFDLRRLAGPWLLFWTLNVSMRTADFWAAGGFDEDFRGWGYEDVELGFRLFRRGVAFDVSRSAWAIEWPSRPDVAANVPSSARNLRRFLDKARHPDVELYASLRTRFLVREFERAHAALRDWARHARGLDVRAELAAVEAERPAGGRVAVIGCGAGVPAHWPASVLVDFDDELLARAAASGAHTPVHAVGLDTGLPDGAVDLVVVSSRLRGLWDRWADGLLAEADRIGRRTLVPFATAS